MAISPRLSASLMAVRVLALPIGARRRAAHHINAQRLGHERRSLVFVRDIARNDLRPPAGFAKAARPPLRRRRPCGSETTTLAPSRAIASALARPMPRLEPTTI